MLKWLKRIKETFDTSKPPLKEKLRDLYNKGRHIISKHIWLELLTMVTIGLATAGVVFLIVSHFINSTDMGKRTYITYTEGREYVQNEILYAIERINAIDMNEIGANVDLNYLKEAIEVWPKEETIGYIEQTILDSYSYVGDENDQLSGEELYKELVKLVEEDKWSKGEVISIIKAYFEKKGITQEIMLEKKLQEILFNSLEGAPYVRDSQTYLVDGTGKIMYDDSTISGLNLINAIKKANNSELNQDQSQFIGIYPVILNDEVYYLYNETSLEPVEHKVYTDLGNILAFIAGAGVFILIIFRLTRDKISYIEYLSQCLEEISKGNLDYKIEIIGKDELAEVAQSITDMEKKLKYQIEAQMAAEKSKNELVTNVAHDLRTPLTSIIGYIGLVKSGTCQTPEDQEKYLDIAYTKAEKLKILIEDLFELTKFHQQAIKLKKQSISLSNLMNQLIEELMPLASEKNIEIKSYIDTVGTTIEVDIQKITRVFENLIENAIKYSPENEEVYIELRVIKNNIYVVVSNTFDNISKEEVTRFFERFYRADKSRNSMAGGSGLGLAIAKNIVELHGGKITAGLNQDLISFKLSLPKESKS